MTRWADQNSRPVWDDYFLAIAKTVSTRADCSRRQVGAVIVGSDHRIVSTGYNGGPSKGPSCLAGECPRARSTVAPGSSYDTGAGSCIAVHAEANAIIYADYSALRGSTMYVTDWPCDGCSRLINGAGISRVVTPVEETLPEYDGPRRGDPVAEWIKKMRDGYTPYTFSWYAVDDMLDNYRLHADLGTSLDEDVESRLWAFLVVPISANGKSTANRIRESNSSIAPVAGSSATNGYPNSGVIIVTARIARLKR